MKHRALLLKLLTGSTVRSNPKIITTSSIKLFELVLTNKMFTWAVLLFLVLMSHVGGLFEVNNLDDLGFYRASSYISEFPNDALLSRLQDDLKSRSDELGEYRYRRYQLRLGFPDNYVGPNWLVGVLERLPLYSAYQSVFLANLLLHLLAVASTFLAFDRVFKSDSVVFRLSFLLSLSPSIFFHPVHIAHLFPFQNVSEHVLWSAAVPRGASLTFFFASLLFWLNIGEPAISQRNRLGLGVLLSLASILSHRSVGLLLVGSVFAVASFYRVIKADPREIARRFGVGWFLLLFNGLIAFMAISKVMLLLVYGAADFDILTLGGTSSLTQLWKHAATLLSWTLGINILAYCWLRLYPGNDGEENRVWRAGEYLFRYLVPFSIIGIGVNVFHPSESLWWGSLHYPSVASLRITGLAHILWWMVFGCWLHVGLTQRNKHALYAAVATVLILLCGTTTLQLLLRENKRQSIFEIFNKEKLTIQSSLLLARPGIEAYTNEALYFQAIANELRKKNNFGYR